MVTGGRYGDLGGTAGTAKVSPASASASTRSFQAPFPLRVRTPVLREISKRFHRHSSQEACPWNVKFSRAASEPALTPREELVTPDFTSFTMMDDTEFKARFGDTPLSRAKRAGLARNVAANRDNRAR
jgi:hypothetical protein